MVSTGLHLNSITEKQAGQAFNVSGFVYRRDNGGSLGGVPVRISVNGTTVKTVNTRSNAGIYTGDFNTDITIAEAGSYTVRADFDGATRSELIFDSSSGVRSLGVENAVVFIVLAVLGYSVIRTLYSWARPEWFLRKRVVRAR